MNRPGVAVFVGVFCLGAACFGEPASIVIDADGAGHAYEGFGVQVWPSDMRVEKVFEALKPRWVRVSYGVPAPVPAEGGREVYDAYWAKTDPAGMRATWELMQRHGIKMILCNFAIPEGKWVTEKRLDPAYHEAFARWWGALVAFLSAQGMAPAYLELFNEPDGDWNGRVGPEDYNRVVALVRAELDARGLRDVQIVGPGLSHIELEGPDQWMESLDDAGMQAIGAWSVHGWEWREGKNDGACHVRKAWAAGFGKSIVLRDPERTRPVFVTEFGTKADTFHGVKPAVPLDTMPCAIRCVENALSVLNMGANVVCYWEGVDQCWEPETTWGLVNLQGEPRPVFRAFQSFVPEIPVGSRILEIAAQDAEVYASAFRSQERLVVVLVNSGKAEHSRTVVVKRAGSLVLRTAKAFVGGAIVPRDLELAASSAGECSVAVSLPGDSIMTLVLGVRE